MGRITNEGVKGNLEQILANLEMPASLDHAKELKRKAEVLALLTIPDEIRVVFDQIEERYREIIGLGMVQKRGFE